MSEGIVDVLGDGLDLNDARGKAGQPPLAGIDAPADAPNGVGGINELGVVLIHQRLHGGVQRANVQGQRFVLLQQCFDVGGTYVPIGMERR